MKSTLLRRPQLVLGISFVMLALMGLRCDGFKPAALPTTTTIPTYTEKTVFGKVVWPPKESVDKTTLETIPLTEREKIKLSGVPVLVPSDPKLLGKSQIFRPDEHGYSFGSEGWIDGISFSITGNRTAGMSDAPVPTQLYEDNPNDVLINGYSVSFSQNENDNWSATWAGYGEAGYLMSLYCENQTDPRCLDTAYFIKLIRDLVFVGGNFIPYETEVKK